MNVPTQTHASVASVPDDSKDPTAGTRLRTTGRQALAALGLKWHPFTPDIPTEACRVTPSIQMFYRRVEALAASGGFALVTGDPGTGKSVALRILESRLANVPDLAVRVLTRPQCSLADFYRELGELFGVPLRPHNRWAGSRALRERWRAHTEAAFHRPVLLVDEAQEMQTPVLIELRLLASCDLDSRSLLTVVLAGDDRLTASFRIPELLSLGSRIRTRLTLGPSSPEELEELLRHATAHAGNEAILTEELVRTLAQHAAGNPRILMGMAAELLEEALRRDAPRIDEKLFFEVFSPQVDARRPRRRNQP